MNGKPGQDYLADFATIGAQPGCSVVELEAAWRRRVSDLHPDRPPAGDGAGGTDQRALLSDINGAYRRLRHFQRRHGRLPGSPSPPGAGHAPDPGWARQNTRWHGPAAPTWLLAVFNASLLGLLAILVWLALERLGISDHDGPGRRADAAESTSPPRAPAMDAHHRAPLRKRTTSTV